MPRAGGDEGSSFLIMSRGHFLADPGLPVCAVMGPLLAAQGCQRRSLAPIPADTNAVVAVADWTAAHSFLQLFLLSVVLFRLCSC
jgi:hypothetical protein